MFVYYVSSAKCFGRQGEHSLTSTLEKQKIFFLDVNVTENSQLTDDVGNSVRKCGNNLKMRA